MDSSMCQQRGTQVSGDQQLLPAAACLLTTSYNADAIANRQLLLARPLHACDVLAFQRSCTRRTPVQCWQQHWVGRAACRACLRRRG